MKVDNQLCLTCEKELIEQMKQKSAIFGTAYALGYTIMDYWMSLSLDENERKDNLCPRSANCEKPNFPKMREKSPVFNYIYRRLDDKLDSLFENMLTEEEIASARKKGNSHE